jgi:hypothetical protein
MENQRRCSHFEGSQEGSFLAMDLPLEEGSCKNITIQLYPSPEKHDKNLVRVKQEGGGSSRRGHHFFEDFHT